MPAKTYYYVKPKTKARVAYGQKTVSSDTAVLDRPQPAPSRVHYSISESQIEQTNDGILDMSFGNRQTQAAAVIHTRPAVSATAVLKAMGISLAVVLLYIGGFGVYAQASQMRSGITELANRGVAKLEAAAGFLAEQDFQKATDNFTAAENVFTQAQQELLSLGQSNLYLSGLYSDDFQIITGTKLIDAGLNLSQGGKELVVAMHPTFQYFNSLGTQSVSATEVPGQVVWLLSNSSQQLDRAVGKITKANALLASIDPDKIDPGYQQAVIQAQVKTATLQQATSVLGTLAQELPDALGFNNPRQYLLLNQNNNELRATGGFIGSFTVVKLYKGQIEDIRLDITQRIDGQNPRPSLEIPAPLRTISQTGTFGTRDSNWYPDFPTSAQTFQQLYEEGGGGTLDGIIAINPRLMQNLLAITGPIELPGKGEVVTANNFVDLTQEYTQFIDNKTDNPKEILGELAPIMLDRLLSLPASELSQVNEILVNLLNSKEIMIYTRNTKLAGAITTLGYSGTMPILAPNQDFLGVIRSNLGGRKSSGKLASRISHYVSVNATGEAETTLTLSYTHQGTDTFPDGPNKDYVRIYTPLGSKLNVATGQDDGTTIETYEDEGKTVFGLWITTQPSQTHDVTLKYTPNISVSNQYSLRVFKQSGDSAWLKSTLRTSSSLGIDGDLNQKTKQLYDDKLLADQLFGSAITN
ncbi:MAG: DUF4012 domain-containing protein [Patescibacteria group bacterium]